MKGENTMVEGDKCSMCGEYQMPKLDKDSIANARACQACGYLEEFNSDTKYTVPKVDMWGTE